METTETTRQQKISKQIQRDIAEILQKDYRERFKGLLVTVTAVRVSPDFSYSKIYVSVFPFSQSEAVLEALKHENWAIRKSLGARIKHQIKSVPEIDFFIDDSLEYIENIDKAINR
ncbi:MAG: 30S ribosome-binding factor RbfA [Rikenellaceae bacterium]